MQNNCARSRDHRLGKWRQQSQIQGRYPSLAGAHRAGGNPAVVRTRRAPPRRTHGSHPKPREPQPCRCTQLPPDVLRCGSDEIGRAERRSAFSVALSPLHAVEEAGRPEQLLLNNAGKTPQCVQVGVGRGRGEHGDAAEAKREGEPGGPELSRAGSGARGRPSDTPCRLAGLESAEGDCRSRHNEVG